MISIEVPGNGPGIIVGSGSGQGLAVSGENSHELDSNFARTKFKS